MVWLLALPILLNGQINSFPASESFESAFTTGTDVDFILNWTGNEVSSSSRIFQGSDARTGSLSLNIIPISSFTGEVLISLDFTGINNPKISFYAYSKQNGAVSSTRPVMLTCSTSIDGGNNFLDNVQIGDDSTFPNDNNTSYTQYVYELPNSATNESNVVVRITAARGSGSGSAAELVMDDFSIEEQILPLAISSSTANSANEVVVTFNQEVTQVTAENTNNYSINNSTSVTGASRTSTNEVTLTTSTMTNNNYQVTINNVEDAATNTPSNLTSNFSFITPLSIERLTVLDENSIEVDFNLNVEQTSAETLTNYSVDNSIGNPSAATHSGTDNSVVTLDFASNFGANIFELTVNGITDESSLAVASNLTSQFNYLPLSINSIIANSATTIEITFNQDVETLSAENTANYSIDYGIGTPSSASQNGSNAAIVTLALANAMVNNTYAVTINNVNNTSGNSTASNIQTNTKFNIATNSREIVINEIFADPSGVNQPNPLVLPNGSSDEFIELHNTTSNAIEITDFDLAGGKVGNYVLDAGSFVILTASSNVTDFQPFGDVVAVTSWNSLTNSGEQLILRDNLGNLVDSLTYSTDWYKDSDKADGGWSIEQINPELVCSDINNWFASNDARGATPADQNSIYDNTPDTTAPNLISVMVVSPTQIIALFDEIMDSGSLSSGTYLLDNGATVNSGSPNSPSLRSVTLDLTQAMVSGTLYSLTVNSITDCAGNGLGTNQVQFVFDNEAPVFERFVLKDNTTLYIIFDEELNESIAETESNYSFNQSIGNPGTAILNASNRNRVRLNLGTELVESSTYTLTFENLADSLGNTVSQTNENFTFNSQIDTVIVVTDQLLDVYFDEDVNNTSETLSNYTVDNSIGAPTSANIDGGNARLVHLAFNLAFPENRDILIEFEEIQNSSNSYLQLLNTTFRYDTDNPDLDSLVVLDQNSIQLYFDEVLDQTTSEAINNYSMNNSLGMPTTAVLQSSDSSVILTFATDFTQELENELTYTAIEDPSGNAITTNRTVNFTYDRLPPRLISVTLVSPTVARVEFSEEVVKSFAENTANYSVDNGIGSPLTAARSEENTNQVDLTFSDLGNNAVNTLLISNLTDVFNNSITTTLEGTFSSLNPDFGTFTMLTDTTIQIQFTKNLTQASAEERTNYGFDKGLGPSSIVQDSGDPSIVTLNLTTGMFENINYRLVVSNLQDIDGNILEPQAYDFTFDDFIESISIINSNTLLIDFSVALDENSSEVAANYVLNNNIGNPASATLGAVDSTQVTLIFSTAFNESQTYEVSVSNLMNYFGSIIPHSKNNVTYDVSPPRVTGIVSKYLNELEVSFNEPVEQSSALTLNHYSLNNGGGQPTDISFVSGSTQSVILTFASNLIDATEYTLKVNRIEDLNGKAISNQNFVFTFSAPTDPSFRDLVINEIYFDTDLGSGIPNAEYIEILNRSGQSIELRDFKITDQNDTASLGEYVLANAGILTISSRSNESAFSSYGNALGVSNFPSLSNIGETIVLIDRNEEVIDTLAYSSSFYNDQSKSNGGYSIELINPDKNCYDVNNYGASTNLDGGTPGTQNSIFDSAPDNTAPSVTIVNVNSTTSLNIQFNEAIDVSTLVSGNFNVGDTIAVSSVTINDPFGTNIDLTLASAVNRGTLQSLNISGVDDCSGNELNGSENFVIGAIPTSNQLLITEIMSNPSPPVGLPEREYVEIYNNSNFIIDLGEVAVIDNSSAQLLDNTNLGVGEYIILSSNQGASELNVFGTTLGINSFPTLSANDQVGLVNSLNDTIFYVDFDNSFYNDENKNSGGYSIEIINLNPSCYDNSNWTASIDTNGGTPGTQNSVFDNSLDTGAPSISSFTTTRLNQLSITFSESMNVGTLVINNFSVDNGITISDIQILDEFGSQILLDLSQDYTAGALYTLTLSNLADCAGNALPVTQLTFSRGAKPTTNELIITEIMATPTPSQGLPEREYIEVLNVSGEILALDGVIFSDATSSTTLPSYNLSPGKRIILTPNSGVSDLSAYGDVLGVSNWPNLNRTSDRLRLHNSSNQEIFRVNYNDSWYANATKAMGGYSLEMIDTKYSCLEESNWRASDSPTGGTPGTINSTNGSNPDLVGPNITLAVAIDQATIQVNFNEKLNVDAVDPSDFSSDNGISFIAALVAEDEKSVSLTTNVDLTPNTVYTLIASNITDCTGNLISANGNSFDVIVAAEADSLDILVNEILFNPNSGGVRFVEIYNNSNKYLNLKDWKVAGLNNSRIISQENLFFQPGAYLIITSDGTILSNQYPNAITNTIIEVSSMPSLPASGGTVFIYDPQENTIDSFDFNESNHSPLLSETRGVSLERISFAGPSNDSNNWFSSSQTEGFATPGYLNSQASGLNPPAGMVQVDPPTFAPDVPGASNFTMLNYQFDNPGNTLTIKIVNASGDIIRTVVQNAIVGREGFFTWDGTLANGGKARVGYYMVLMEIISSEGEVSYIRDRVAIGSRF